MAGLYTYADASVLCARPEFVDDKRDMIKSPDAIFEVLSETTESYDRSKKFEHYRSIPSLANYVLVPQDRIMVEQFTRQPDGTWVLQELRAGHPVRLPCGEVAVDLLYRNILPFS